MTMPFLPKHKVICVMQDYMKLLLSNFKPRCICNVEDQSTGGSIATVDLKTKNDSVEKPMLKKIYISNYMQI
jgi:hypothetical protein